MHDRWFVILFFSSLFGSLAVFFVGVAALWRVSIENRELQRKHSERGAGVPGH